MELIDEGLLHTYDKAIESYVGAKEEIGPAKAANAGGVACSCIEMGQNAGHTVFQHEDVYAQLHQIMRNIFNACANAGEKYYDNKNALVQGANIAGFERVAQAMMEQGLV